jgi:hypothetical protein
MLKKVKPKMLHGKPISGTMLIELAESYIGAMNSGKVPTIDTAWQNVQKSELERAFSIALKSFKITPTGEDQSAIKQQIAVRKQEALKIFNREMIQGISQEPIAQQFLQKLKTELKL